MCFKSSQLSVRDAGAVRTQRHELDRLVELDARTGVTSTTFVSDDDLAARNSDDSSPRSNDDGMLSDSVRTLLLQYRRQVPHSMPSTTFSN
jgi:hypothetical protein